MKDKSLLKIYNAILAKPEKWMYYRDNQTFNISIADILTNEDDALRWIKNYFACGLKSCLWDDLHSNDHTIHSISTFLLGIRLHKMFGVEEYYKSKWLYYWFLICLYHDAGYNVEKNQKNYPLSMTLLELCNSLNISQKSINELLNYLPTSKSDAVRIDRILIEKYYDYCRNKNDKPFINHGIVSGAMLFERLTNYLHDILKGSQSIVVKNRQFRQSDETNFKIIAESIIHHHIWAETDEKKFDTYISAGLSELCINHDSRLWYTNPLTNLLIFCDSIEPTKNHTLFPQLTTLEILDNLYVTHSVKNKTITLQVNPRKSALVGWLNNIKSKNIQSWLSVDISRNISDNTNIITYQLIK